MQEPNISNFLTQFKNTELARPYNFDVTIYPTTSFIDTLVGSSVLGKIFQKRVLDDGHLFKTKCEATELPGRSFSLSEYQTYGPSIKIPIQNTFDSISLTFICSDDMWEKKFFDTWMETISISHPLGSIFGLADQILESQSIGIDTGFGVRYDFSYKDDYTSTIEITQYDLTGKASYKVNLVDAFPYAVNPMPLNWGAYNQYHKVNVNFSYKYFTILENII